MNFKITGRGLDITDGMIARCEKALSKLDKYNVFPSDVCAKVVVKASPENKIEITIPTRLTKSNILRAETTYQDFYSDVSECVDKLENQIKKNSTLSFNKKATFNTEEDYLKACNIKRVKNLIPDVISIDEAIQEMNLVNHDFYIFIDIDNNTPALLYRRKVEGYGIIYIK